MVGGLGEASIISAAPTQNFTFADVACFEAVNAVINIYGLNVLRPFPKLKEFHDKVAAHARIEHHIQTRAPGF